MQEINSMVNVFQGNILRNMLNIVSIFLLSFASSILGYSIYLFMEAFSLIEIKYSSWSGEALMWGLVLLFASLFILFIPIELRLIKWDKRADFQNVLGRIITTVILSVVLLFISSLFFKESNIILQNINVILRAFAFSGLVFVNIVSFLIWWGSNSFGKLNRYSLTLTGTAWVLGSLVFIS